jgi:hypothetical protein
MTIKRIAFISSLALAPLLLSAGVVFAATPIETLSARPSTALRGGPVTLTRSSTNTGSCAGTGFTASGPGGPVVACSTQTPDYSLACAGRGGSVGASTLVTVSGLAPGSGLPADARTMTAANLSVRSNGQTVSASIVEHVRSASDTITIGYLDRIDSSGKLYGWALDKDASSQSIPVEFYLDGFAGQGTFLGSTTANAPRPDINQAGYPGDHGFEWTIPSQYQSAGHNIYAYAGNRLLSGWPKEFEPPATFPAGSGTIDMHASYSHTVEEWSGRFYSFSVPASNARFIGFSGNIAINATGHTKNNNTYMGLAFTETLINVYTLPSGSCPPGKTVNNEGELIKVLEDFRSAEGLASFMIKLPTNGAFELPTEISLPIGLPISNCVFFYLWGGYANGGTYAMTSNMVMHYASASSAVTIKKVDLDDEFGFGYSFDIAQQNTKGSGPHVSFMKVAIVDQAADLLALYGNVSDSIQNGNSGKSQTSNDFYVYPQCGLSAGYHGPADYYASVPSNATRLLSLRMQTDGLIPLQKMINETFNNVHLNAGDCLIHLISGTVSAGSNMNVESQVKALVRSGCQGRLPDRDC